MPVVDEAKRDIPLGLCQCGCGARTSLARHSSTARGWVKGKPLLYVQHHSGRTHPQKPFTSDLYEVRDCGFETPCWVWLGSKDSKGYGRTRYAKQGCAAHRRAWMQLVGPLPAGHEMELDHLCRNSSCVNPLHLELVTGLINVRRGLRPKLAFEKAEEIRAIFAAEKISKRELGHRFGVSDCTIGLVIRGQRWTH